MTSLATFQLRRTVENHAYLAYVASLLGLAEKKDYHVTLAYSRTPVDWDDPVFAPLATALLMEEQDYPVLKMGPNEDLLALGVPSVLLRERHAQLRDNGAVWEFGEYQPHITLGPLSEARNVPEVITLETLVLGPEERKATK